MAVDLSMTSLVLGASLLVKLVMLLLLLASLWSWTVIFTKRALIRRARRDADKFEERFWSAGDLTDLYTHITQRGHEPAGLERIFEAGIKEFAACANRMGLSPWRSWRARNARCAWP